MVPATRLSDVLKRLGAESPPGLSEQLIAAYSEPHRFYHTGQHIASCLKNLDIHRAAAERPDEIEVAIWFHDAVYETRNADNEEASAAWARSSLNQARLNEDAIDRIAQMILATKGHIGATGDERLLLDIDLSVLGTEPDTFRAYDDAIRREYFWVPEAEFRVRRMKVLRTFLARPHIYETLQFRATHELVARENLNAAIHRLGT